MRFHFLIIEIIDRKRDVSLAVSPPPPSFFRKSDRLLLRPELLLQGRMSRVGRRGKWECGKSWMKRMGGGEQGVPGGHGVLQPASWGQRG